MGVHERPTRTRRRLDTFSAHTTHAGLFRFLTNEKVINSGVGHVGVSRVEHGISSRMVGHPKETEAEKQVSARTEGSKI